MSVKTQQIYYDLLLQGYIRGPDDDSKESKHVALK